MLGTSFLISPQLRDMLLNRADHLLDPTDPVMVNNSRRLLQFLRNIKFGHCNPNLLEKCNRIMLDGLPQMNIEEICLAIDLFENLRFRKWEFKLAAIQRLMELMDSSTDPFSFTRLFVTLYPMASPEVRERFV